MLVLFAFAKANSLQAQSKTTKQEKEERVQQASVPTQALQETEAMAAGSRIKFYLEYDGDKTSYEGKFKKDGRRYSMEYTSTGELEDVEIEIKRRNVSKRLWESMAGRLDSIASRWRVEKIQQQYLPVPDGLNALKDNIDKERFDHLELIVAFKENRKIYRKEILFDLEGIIVNIRDVKRIAYDFLLF